MVPARGSEQGGHARRGSSGLSVRFQACRPLMWARAFWGAVGRAAQGDVGHVAPRKFKERIGRLANGQFTGYAQHDSQVGGAGPR